MPVSHDVMEIIRVLDEEGFGFLASELLAEVTLGIELDLDGGEADLEGEANTEAAEPAPPPMVDLGEDDLRIQRYFDADGGKGGPPPRYEGISEPDQLAFAMEFLRLRLVEPIKHLAEAEQLASKLVGDAATAPAAERPEQPEGEALPAEKFVRIAFTSHPLGEPLPVDTRVAGSSVEAEDLAEVLQRISKVKA